MRARPFVRLWTLAFLILLVFFAGCAQTSTGSTAWPGSPAVTLAQPGYAPEGTTAGPAFTVAATVSRSTDRTIEITYQGENDAEYLQYISVTVNGADEGGVGPVQAAAYLPVGTSELFAAHDRGQDHVVGTGHFTNNGVAIDQVVIDTTI